MLALPVIIGFLWVWIVRPEFRRPTGTAVPEDAFADDTPHLWREPDPST